MNGVMHFAWNNALPLTGLTVGFPSAVCTVIFFDNFLPTGSEKIGAARGTATLAGVTAAIGLAVFSLSRFGGANSTDQALRHTVKVLGIGGAWTNGVLVGILGIMYFLGSSLGQAEHDVQKLF